MGMNVNKSGGNHSTGNIQTLLAAGHLVSSDAGDAAVLNTYRSGIGLIAHAVRYKAAVKNQIIHTFDPLLYFLSNLLVYRSISRTAPSFALVDTPSRRAKRPLIST